MPAPPTLPPWRDAEIPTSLPLTVLWVGRGKLRLRRNGVPGRQGDREGDGSLDPGLPIPIHCGVTGRGLCLSPGALQLQHEGADGFSGAACV